MKSIKRFGREIKMAGVGRRVRSSVLWLILLGLGTSASLGQQATTRRPFQNQAAAQMQQSFRALELKLSSTEIVSELRKLPATDDAMLNDKFATFGHHANSASRLDAKPSPNIPVVETPKLSRQTQLMIKHALSPATIQINGAATKTILMSQLPQQQAWAALEGLEADQEFETASLLAKAMREREGVGKSRNLLALVAARDAWLEMNTNDQNGEYDQLLGEACNASDDTVAGQAKLWREATTKPHSAEGIIFAHQLWETVRLDLDKREKGGAISFAICQSAREAFAQEQAIDRPQAERDAVLGQMLSAICEAAYQVHHDSLIKWAVAIAPGLKQALPEDKLMPQYYYALRLYMKDSFALSCKEFEKVFFSGVSCDASAEAGYYMAHCFYHQNDLIGAIATLEMLNKLYSTQKLVMPKANALLSQLRKATENQDPKLVSQYIDEHYRGNFERALAERIKYPPSRQVAVR